MRPSFVRKGAVGASDPGTRPGLYGQTLISSGHAELDKILGGGLPLGSLLLLLEDGSSRHHATLLRYFLGEGAACGQAVALATAELPSGGLAQFIPQQLRRSVAKQAKEEDGQQEEEEQYTLRIAWQYRRYLQPAGTASRAHHSAATRAGAAGADSAGGAAVAASPPSGGGLGQAGADSEAPGAGSGKRVRIAAPAAGAGAGRLKNWCHQLDLGRGLGEEELAKCRATLIDCSEAQSSSACLLSGVTAFMQSLEQQQQQQSSASAPSKADVAGGPAGQQPQPKAAAGQAAAQAARDQGGACVAAAQLVPRAALPTGAAAPLRGPQQVGRLAVLSLGSPDWWTGGPALRPPRPPPYPGIAGIAGAAGAPGSDLARQVLWSLLRLKAAVRERRCAAVVTVPAALHAAADVARFAHLADAVLALESVADSSDIVRLAPDSASVAGLLHVRKLPSLGVLAPSQPEVSLYLIRNKRRRLSITPVEIDPDAEAGLSEAGGGGGSAASMLCGGPPKASSALDF